MLLKAVHYFVVLFIMLYKVVLMFAGVWIKCLSVTIQIKAIEHYFPVVLFITCMLCKVVLTFLSLWMEFT